MFVCLLVCLLATLSIHHLYVPCVVMPCFVPECLVKGSRFTVGDVFALRCFCARNRSQPSATVLDDCAMAAPVRCAARVATLGGFKPCITSFRVAVMVLRDIPTCFTMCQRSLCVRGAILLRPFPKMSCIVRGRRSALDVWRCVFLANRIARATSSGDNV